MDLARAHADDAKQAEHLQCCVCTTLPSDVATLNCEHVLCMGCCVQLHQPRCPMCRAALPPHARTTNHFQLKTIQQLRVTCEHEGCTAVVSLGQAANHGGDCGFAPVWCGMCEQMVTRRTFAHHAQHECECRLEKCDRCGDGIAVRDMEEHFRDQDLDMCAGLMLCPNKCTAAKHVQEYGQPHKKMRLEEINNFYVTRIRVKDQQRHLEEECPRRDTPCPFGNTCPRYEELQAHQLHRHAFKRKYTQAHLDGALRKMLQLEQELQEARAANPFHKYKRCFADVFHVPVKLITEFEWPRDSESSTNAPCDTTDNVETIVFGLTKEVQPRRQRTRGRAVVPEGRMFSAEVHFAPQQQYDPDVPMQPRNMGVRMRLCRAARASDAKTERGACLDEGTAAATFHLTFTQGARFQRQKFDVWQTNVFEHAPHNDDHYWMHVELFEA